MNAGDGYGDGADMKVVVVVRECELTGFSHKTVEGRCYSRYYFSRLW